MTLMTMIWLVLVMTTRMTSMRVRGMVTRQRQRSETARLAMNTFLVWPLVLLMMICSNDGARDVSRLLE